MFVYMKTTINNNLRLTIPYQDSTLTFDPIPYSGKFFELKEKARNDGLRMPTMEELFAIVSFGELSFNQLNYGKNLEYYMDIIRKSMMDGSWLAADTGVLYEEGVGFYVADNISMKSDSSKDLGRKVTMNFDKKDKSTIFIPDGKFKIGNILGQDIESNPLVQALIGESGAKLAASRYGNINIWELLKKGEPLYALINKNCSRFKIVDYYFDYASRGKCFGIDDNLDNKLL